MNKNFKNYLVSVLIASFGLFNTYVASNFPVERYIKTQNSIKLEIRDVDKNYTNGFSNEMRKL